MEANTHKKAYLSDSFSGLDPLTRDVIHARARELAAKSGRKSTEVTQADYEQARREATRASEAVQSEKAQTLIPQSEGWKAVPAPGGTQADEFPREEENAEGRSEKAQSAEKGVAKAEREQVRAAAREADRKERGGG